MPYVKIDHLKARKIICAACGVKDKNCIDIEKNENLLKLVKEISNESVEVAYLNQPTGLCKTCKNCLYTKKRDNEANEERETKWLINKLIIETLPRFKGKDSNLNHM